LFDSPSQIDDDGGAEETNETTANREVAVNVDSVKTYLNEISKHRLLKADEEKSLARALRGGDAAARHRLIQSNLRLVVNIARRYTNQGLSLQDLVQEGSIGLMRAVEKFDPEKGYRFSLFHIRDLVDSPGDESRHCRQSGNDPSPRPHASTN
jgi:RNA polymerase nonessential primary-like sigma factor